MKEYSGLKRVSISWCAKGLAERGRPPNLERVKLRIHRNDHEYFGLLARYEKGDLALVLSLAGQLLVADLPAISGDFQARRIAMAKRANPMSLHTSPSLERSCLSLGPKSTRQQFGKVTPPTPAMAGAATRLTRMLATSTERARRTSESQ